jgi:hypothetical protein
MAVFAFEGIGLGGSGIEVDAMTGYSSGEGRSFI